MALSRLGVINSAVPSSGTDYATEFALFRRDYTTAILAAFARRTVFADRIMRRTITSGVGANFPLTGKTTAQYFLPGTSSDLGGDNDMPLNEVKIEVDRPLVSDIYVSEIDELLTNLDLRGQRAIEQGYALANANDRCAAQKGVLTARATNALTGTILGGTYVPASGPIDTSGDAILLGINNAVQKFAGNDVPLDPGDVTAFFRPAQYYLLTNSDKVANRFYSPNTDVNVTGVLPNYLGVDIVMTNNLPITSISAVTGQINVYNGDFSKTRGLVLHKSAIGGIQLMDVNFDTQYKLEKLANLFVAKMMVGYGTLRTEGAVELANN